MKLFFAAFCLVSLTCIHAQELPADGSTLLLLHFNGNTTGAGGESPLSSANIGYATGKHGKALQITSNTTLRFDTTKNINVHQGTIEFWIKPSSEGVALDMGVGGGLSAQVGNFTRMIFNIFGINGNPENGVFGNNTIWKPNTWYHLAFTWQNRVAKIYYNGALTFSNTIQFDFPDVNLTYFNIGSTVTGGSQLQGLMDELRISNQARTAVEISQDYLMGELSGGITNLHVRDTATVTMYKTWDIYLEKPGFWKVPSLYTLNGTDTVNVANTGVTWSVSNTSILGIANGVLIAKNAGTATLTATMPGQSVSIPVRVKAPVKQAEYETNVDAFLKQPVNCAKVIIPVVAIIYLPTNDGVNINTAETDVLPLPQQTIDAARAHILRINSHTKFSLEEGSKFRGYAHPGAYPYAGYKVIDYIYVYEPMPRGFPTGDGAFFSDYNQIITRFNGKKYVDTLGVKEFWVMGYHHGEIVPVESNMSSPTTGDISNSFRSPDDMPVYSKTYILYNYNMTRSGNEAVHNHGHQIESMVDYVAQKQDGNTNLFTVNFRGYNTPGGQPAGRCGDTHHTPNSNADYDYNNTTPAESDILDWKPAGGTKTMVNVNTWGNINYPYPSLLYPDATPNAESNWYIMWMQSLPGFGNQIPYNGKWMTNWWRFLADWDSATAKIGLYQNVKEPAAACTALPIRLLSFTATLQTASPVKVSCRWVTAQAESTAGFAIERSSDAANFYPIGRLTVKGGDNGVTTYNFDDMHPLTANSFYRLKMLDRDGSFSYSKTAKVSATDIAAFSIHPNPASDMLFIKGNDIGEVKISDNTGKIVLHKQLTGPGEATINIANLSKGLYMVQMTDAKGKVQTQKLVIN